MSKDLEQLARERDDTERFSVYQFFPDGNYERFTNLPAKNAVETAYHWTHNVASMAGVTRRVTITDNGDRICFEWIWGKGVTFPEPLPKPQKDYRK